MHPVSIEVAVPVQASGGSELKRQLWIDVAKGIGIILVVIGHIGVERNTAQRAIYLFHMPLFFMLAGYLMSPKPWLRFASSRFRTLMIPYACYAVGLSALALFRAPNQAVPMLLWGGRHFTPQLGVFWFVTVLFLAQLAFAALLRGGGGFAPAVFLPVGVIAALGYLIAAYDWPGNAALVPAGIFFLWAGFALKSIGFPQSLLISSLLIAVSAVVGWPALSSPERWPELPFNMFAGVLGYPVYGLCLAIALSILMMRFSQLIERLSLIAKAFASIG